MKTLQIFLLLLFTSCVTITYKVDETTNLLPIIKKEVIPSHTDITYHWGYSISNGKYCMHWGPEKIETKYILYYILNNDTDDYHSNKKMYDSLSVGDFLTMQYKYKYIDDVLSDTLIVIK